MGPIHLTPFELGTDYRLYLTPMSHLASDLSASDLSTCEISIKLEAGTPDPLLSGPLNSFAGSHARAPARPESAPSQAQLQEESAWMTFPEPTPVPQVLGYEKTHWNRPSCPVISRLTQIEILSRWYKQVRPRFESSVSTLLSQIWDEDRQESLIPKEMTLDQLATLKVSRWRLGHTARLYQEFQKRTIPPSRYRFARPTTRGMVRSTMASV